MSALLSLLIRHALMLCAGFFAAHGIDGSSSVGLITGLLMLACVTAWSLAEKWLNLRPGQLTDSAMLRTIVGALASQLVTAASAYFAVDANQPELLGVALVNAGLSKAGVHQKLAALGSGKAALLLALGSSLFALPSCSLTPTQRAALAQSIVPLSELGLSLAQSRGVIQPGDRVLIGQGLALIIDDASSTRDKVVRLSALGVQAAVDRGALQEGDALLIQSATAIIDRALPRAETSAKQPVEAVINNNPSGSNAEAASSSQSRACGLLNPSAMRGAPNCAACHAGSSAEQTARVSDRHVPALALAAR
jgi:hypothetical protein